MNKILLVFGFILLTHNGTRAQDCTIKGEISNDHRERVESAIVLVYKDNAIIGHAYTDKSGFFQIELKDLQLNDDLLLEINLLGYQSAKHQVIYTGQKEIFQDFILVEKIEKLDEIVLEAWEKIKIKTDTITFRASSYTTGNEQVVEDLLRNLPGVEIIKDGTITVNGRSIDKLLVEGDDLFDEKYKLLSKNLDAKTISEIQILNNFEDNPVLKSFQESEKVALNLKLYEDKKNVVFGNLGLGYGTTNRYEGSSNIGLLSKKIKFFSLSDLNNTKRPGIPQINNYYNKIGASGIENKVEKRSNVLLDIDDLTSSNFSRNEDIFNSSALKSLSFVTKLSERTKLRSHSYYAVDRIEKQNSNDIIFFIPPESVEFSEQRSIDINEVFFGTEFELKHHNANNMYLEYSFAIESNPTEKNGILISNDNEILQEQADKKQNIFNHLNLNKKLTDNKLLSIYSYYGKNRTEQDYLVTPNIFEDVIEAGNPESIINQNSNTPLEYAGIITEIVSKRKKSELAIEVLGSLDRDKIQSSFSIDNGAPIDSLSNDTDYKKIRFGLTGKYVYKFSDSVKVRTTLNISRNHVKLNGESDKLLFINPQIGFIFKKSNVGSFRLNYGYRNNLPLVQYLNENYLLTNYRTFSRGLNDIEPLKNHNISLSYTYNSYKKLLLINSFLRYGFSNIDYANQSSLNTFSSFNNYQILDGGSIFSGNFGITTYLKNLPVSVKLSTEQSLNDNNVILNSIVDNVQNYNAKYRLQGTTYLNIPLNFKFYLQYNYFKGEFSNSIVSNNYFESSLITSAEFLKTLNFQLRNTFYTINRKNFLFTDLVLNFSPKKSRWSYRFSGSNLSNISEFSDVNISEYQTSNSSFKVVPRYLLLNLKYRF